jgi:hypothetical protein
MCLDSDGGNRSLDSFRDVLLSVDVVFDRFEVSSCDTQDLHFFKKAIVPFRN